MRKKLDITTDKALIFSALMILVFTIVMVVTFFLYQSVPDSLIMAFFGCFGLEGGYCAFIQKIKKTTKTTDEEADDIEILDDESGV